jgi:DNA-binding NtrC family response regulator
MIDLVDSYLNSCKQLYRYVTTAQPRLIISFSQESYHEILNTEVWNELLEKLDPIAIMVPPLRERKEDIPIFIDSFLSQVKKITTDSNNLSISEQALHECMTYSWPGNIRQLKNAMYHAAILSHGQKIENRHLPFSMKWSLPYEIDDQRKPGRQ